MSLTISLRVPGLTEESAHSLSRAATLEGAPFTAVWSRGGHLPRPRAGRWTIAMHDLDSDPSVASETLDHPDGWPEAPSVRDWLARAFAFLVAQAPESRFSVSAGWGDHGSGERIAVSAEALLELVNAGRLRADVTYDVG
jgi:hypothetical protein